MLSPAPVSSSISTAVPTPAAVDVTQEVRRYPGRITRRPTVLERPEDEFTGPQFLLDGGSLSRRPHPSAARSRPPPAVPSAPIGPAGAAASARVAAAIAPSGAVVSAAAPGPLAEESSAVGRRASTWLQPGDTLPEANARGPAVSGEFHLRGDWARQEDEPTPPMPCIRCISLWEHDPLQECGEFTGSPRRCSACAHAPFHCVQVRAPFPPLCSPAELNIAPACFRARYMRSGGRCPHVSPCSVRGAARPGTADACQCRRAAANHPRLP